jgi:hypothetical protein
MMAERGALASFNLRYAGWQNQRRIARLARQVARHAKAYPAQAPVVVFNASTRLTGLSLNAAFSLLTAWGLRLAGVPVIHFVCRSGMRHCVLGTNRQDYTTPPPCAGCQTQSDRLYSGANVQGFSYSEDAVLAGALAGLSVDELSQFEFPSFLAGIEKAIPIPLGRLVLPSIRWALRMHNLPDDEPTRYLLRQYILSAWYVADRFAALLEQAQPQAAVIFNGIMYPEATARWVARQMGVRSVAHEVGFQRFSAFFTEGEPTAYPIHIPADFELNDEQNARLDAYLEKRFQGQFTMAGIRFWPEMRGLDADFLEKAARFRQIVPIFTNVVYDTSQVHANVIFPHMFAWLDLLLEVIRLHPETLFVIRAHPDEMRPGTAKQSRQSVRDWVIDNGLQSLPNLVFIDSGEYVSSYELIQRARFVIVYNSSIGMEAALMGAAVLCGGNARYTQYPIVFFPASQGDFRQQVEEFLGPEAIRVPPEHRRNARRFLYYQLYRASLPLDDFLENGPRMGFVQLRAFSWQQLLAENSSTMQVLLDGILDRQVKPSAETARQPQAILMPDQLPES